MKRYWSVFAVATLAVSAAACSGGDGREQASVENSAFSAQPGAVATSSRHNLEVALYTLPKDTLVRGNNRILLEVAGADDANAAALDIELETYMPAMGHGASQQPELVEVSANRYTFDKVVLNMPGLWELHVHLSGDVRDELVFEFDVD